MERKRRPTTERPSILLKDCSRNAPPMRGVDFEVAAATSLIRPACAGWHRDDKPAVDRHGVVDLIGKISRYRQMGRLATASISGGWTSAAERRIRHTAFRRVEDRAFRRVEIRSDRRVELSPVAVSGWRLRLVA